MNFSRLNPNIHSVSQYERLNRSEVCVSYDAKLIYLISGELTYTLDGAKGRLSPANLLYIPAGTPYSLKSKYFRAVVIGFDLTADMCDIPCPAPSLKESFEPDKLRCVEDSAPFDKPILLSDLEAERDGFIRMSNIFTSAQGNYLAEISAMLKLVLLKIAEYTDENALPASMVENLDGYIRDNVHDEISNTELGAIFGYHPFYISKMLKDKKGITLHQYVISYRIKCAMRLLECTDKPIADIADETGFTDASYFTKTFKAQFGITPKEYRNKFREDFI